MRYHIFRPCSKSKDHLTLFIYKDNLIPIKNTLINFPQYYWGAGSVLPKRTPAISCLTCGRFCPILIEWSKNNHCDNSNLTPITMRFRILIPTLISINSVDREVNFLIGIIIMTVWVWIPFGENSSYFSEIHCLHDPRGC